jgi:hypothetical protein
LTNADELHYAKVRTFTGSPALVTPDFVDQILIATDTNKIFRANSTATGSIVESLASASNTNNALALDVFTSSPDFPAAAIGQICFDQTNREFWVAVNNAGEPLWASTAKPILTPEPMTVTGANLIYSFGEADQYPEVDLDWQFIFCNTVIEDRSQETDLDVLDCIEVGKDLQTAINTHGPGVYAYSYWTIDPNGVLTSWDRIDVQIYFGGVPTNNVSGDLSSFAVPVGRNGISSQALYLSPFRRLGDMVDVSAQVYLSAQ